MIHALGLILMMIGMAKDNDNMTKVGIVISIIGFLIIVIPITIITCLSTTIY